MNKWQEFSKLHSMTNEDFSDEVVNCAQAVLAMELNERDKNTVTIETAMSDGNYKLTFERVDK